MGEERSIYKTLATIDRRFIYILVIILVLIPVLNPIGMPISVTAGTRQFFDVLGTLEEGDIVFSAWETGFSAYNELKSGIICSHRMIIESGAKSVHAFSTAEGFAIFERVFGNPEKGLRGILTPELEQYDYTYGEDYIVLGYVLVNEASTSSIARDFQGIIYNDWEGDPIAGTFLDDVHDAGDIDLIVDFSPGMQTTALINHWVMDYGTPMIEGAIGVNIPAYAPYVDTGHLLALLQSTRGGAELEYLTGEPGDGLTAMDSFTLVHYLVIIFIVLGNIGYFGWQRSSAERERTAIA
jgi:hypothetical protein